jgi:hypothetical protein
MRWLPVLYLACLAVAGPAVAQAPLPPPAPDHSQHLGHGAGAPLFAPREASGTAWMPADTPMFGAHLARGSWELMLHGQAFGQFLYEGGEDHRRSHQAGSINWLMVMARRPAGPGRVGVRAMLSGEPWTIPGCGYPDLLATGETCDRDSIHDRQHPHDLFMELAAEYERPLRGSLGWQFYAGLAGEPALGPPGFPHRLSALPNPLAPIAHHWLDATHVTFGVLSTGVFTSRWKVDASVFNGREPDERRHDLDLSTLDSYSARLSLMPRQSLVLQVSAGHLNDAEEHGSLPRTDVTRVTASATYHRRVGRGGSGHDDGSGEQDPLYAAERMWATTVAWGVNAEPAAATAALLIESSLALGGSHTLFGRLEVVGKPAHDLHVHESNGVFTVGKLQLGYTRHFASRRGLQTGVGGTVSGGVVPVALIARYGGRVIPGFGVFLAIRPAAHAP